MATDVTVLYEQKFSQIFELLVQQQEMRLPQTARQGNHRGTKGAQAIKQVGVIEADQRTIRLEPITFADAPHDARWVYPIMFDRAVPFDTWDELQTAADPRSSYTQALIAGMNRKKDAEMHRAFFETSHVGETGAGTTAFPTSTQQVAVNFRASGNTHLTVAKLKEAKRILMANEVDLETDQLYCTARAIDIDSLMDEITVTSRDFNDAPVMRDGKLTRFFGFNLIHSELCPTSSSNTLLAAWAGSGVHFGTWQDVETKITQRTDLRGQPWQVYVSAMFGATRLQEKKVVQVLSIT